MKPFCRYAKLSDDCHCGSMRPYRACCFRGETIGFVVAMGVLSALLFLSSGTVLYRIIRAGFGLLTWVCILACLREWFVRKRAKTRKDNHVV